MPDEDEENNINIDQAENHYDTVQENYDSDESLFEDTPNFNDDDQQEDSDDDGNETEREEEQEYGDENPTAIYDPMHDADVRRYGNQDDSVNNNHRVTNVKLIKANCIPREYLAHTQKRQIKRQLNKNKEPSKVHAPEDHNSLDQNNQVQNPSKGLCRSSSEICTNLHQRSFYYVYECI